MPSEFEYGVSTLIHSIILGIRALESDFFPTVQPMKTDIKYPATENARI